MSLGKRMKKASKSEYAQVLSESDKFAIADWISTGNYALNTLISGSPHKGFPSGRVMQLAGPHSTGKTFINLEIARAAQQQGYFIVYYDTEFAQDKESLEERGIDIDQMLYVPIDTVEKLSHSMLNIIEEVSMGEKVMIVVDSIGNLSTNKELADLSEENDKRDMTRAQRLKALFRTVTLKVGLKNIPLILVNHVYACGTKNMNVIMSDNSFKSLGDIEAGDFVKTLFGDEEVQDTFQYEDAEVIEFVLENGEILQFTPKHQFLNDKMEWKTADELQENDSIVLSFPSSNT